MKKIRLLSLTTLALVGILGLSSCSSSKEVIEGPVGPVGPEGPKGEDGTDGEDGLDGSLWLSGTGAPTKDTEAKTNDIYLNTTNGDVYQKQADGSWKLLMNIKGEDGADGEDGTDGRPGGSGSNGATAWSSTILPTTGGYVVPSAGSVKEGENITFTFHPETGYQAASIELNGELIVLTDEQKTNGYTTTMVENGFVVKANFTDDPRFVSGTGSETDPYILDVTAEELVDMFANYKENNGDLTGKHIKISTPNLELDLAEMGHDDFVFPYMDFNFDGNGLTIKNNSVPVVDYVFGDPATGEQLEIKNININTGDQSIRGSMNGALARFVGGNVKVDNINVTGLMQGSSQGGVFGYIFGWDEYETNLYVSNVHCEGTFFSVDGSGAVLLGAKRGTKDNAKIIVDPHTCTFTGTAYVGTNDDSKVGTEAEAYLYIDKSSQNNYPWDDDYNDNGGLFLLGNENHKLTGDELPKIKAEYVKIEKETIENTDGTTYKEETTPFTVNANENAVRAEATLWIGPNPGNLYSEFMREELVLDASRTTFTTNDVQNYRIAINGKFYDFEGNVVDVPTSTWEQFDNLESQYSIQEVYGHEYFIMNNYDLATGEETRGWADTFHTADIKVEQFDERGLIIKTTTIKFTKGSK